MILKLYATYGITESNDDLPILLWNYLPTDNEVDEAYKKRLPHEYAEVGCVYWSIDEAEIIT